jgi:hypothetical protein
MCAAHVNLHDNASQREPLREPLRLRSYTIIG